MLFIEIFFFIIYNLDFCLDALFSKVICTLFLFLVMKPLDLFQVSNNNHQISLKMNFFFFIVNKL